jgi:hypothetical protein
METRPVDWHGTLESRGILTALDTPVTGRNPRERWWAAAELLS